MAPSPSSIPTDNRVVATIPVHKLPYVICVDSDRASRLRSQQRIEHGQRHRPGPPARDCRGRHGRAPGLARISPDRRTLVVTNRGSGSVSIFDIPPYAATQVAASWLPLKAKPAASGALPRLRVAFSGCTGATDATILPDSSKAFIACSGGHQVMVVSLAAEPGSWRSQAKPFPAHGPFADPAGRRTDPGPAGAQARRRRDLLLQLRLQLHLGDQHPDQRDWRHLHHRQPALPSA